MILDKFSLNKTTFGLLNDSKGYAHLEKNDENLAYEKLDIGKIIQVNFPEDQYYREAFTKKQIVLHHTVSGEGVNGDLNWWLSTPERVATAVVVDWKGDIYQCFSSKYWAHHLGLKTLNNKTLNQQSIGIEIDSWGGLIKHNKQWYPAKWDEKLNKNVANITQKPIANVVEFPKGFRGFYGYERYSDAQIESVRKLLTYWNETYGIPLGYNADMWNISQRALNGESGVWSHVSYRSDKSDAYPDERLIAMLKSLTK